MAGEGVRQREARRGAGPAALAQAGRQRRRRAACVGLPQLFVALAQPLVRRETRQESGSAAFVELVVDQRDKFGVIVGHRYACQTLLFQFRQRRAPGGQSAHDRADRDAERRRRFGVTVPFAIDQQDRLALRLREAADRS